jgi:hypothetical protein
MSESETECRGCQEMEQLLLYSHKNNWNVHLDPSQTESRFRAGKRFANGNMRLVPLPTLDGAVKTLQEIDRTESRKPSAREYSQWKDDQYHGR